MCDTVWEKRVAQLQRADLKELIHLSKNQVCRLPFSLPKMKFRRQFNESVNYSPTLRICKTKANRKHFVLFPLIFFLNQIIKLPPLNHINC